jgi:serine phosphatase RsbU (regulator of sigma subunit)
MTAIKQILISLILALNFFNLFGQTGAPLLTHYSNRYEIENQNWAICQDKNDVMMFANRLGILTFDGQSEGLIQLPTIPAALGFCKTDSSVYVGGENDYGYLQRDDKGNYIFRSLNIEKVPVGLITRIIFTDTTVFFYGEQSISRHNLKTGALELRLFQNEQKPFKGMFVTKNNTFINVSAEGLYRLESDTLFPIVTGYMLENEEVLFCLPFDEKMVLLGLGNGNLSLFDGIKFYIYPVRDDDYLKQNVLSDGITISDSLYAFSTVGGGVLVVDRRSGIVRKTINYLRGLPDDEIFAMGTDNNNGLWLSHQYGLTRAELMLPVGNFTIYKGLTGNLISSVFHNNELYVGTSEGVFYLDQVRDFTNEEILVIKQPIPGKPLEISPAEIPPGKLKPLQDQGSQKSRKSVFSRIFGKKAETVVEPETIVAETSVPQVVTDKPQVKSEPVYVRKTISRLKSVNYVFRKAEGLDDKCKQMVSTPDGILASTNQGLFLIKDHKARPLVNNRYIYLVSSRSADNRYYVATAEGYFYVTASAGVWKAVYPDSQFTQPVYTVVASDVKTLWAGADNEVLKITLDEKPIYTHYKMDSDHPLRYVTNFEKDTLFVFSTSGVSYYDSKSDSVKRYMQGFDRNGTSINYVISQPDSPWVKQGDDWICLGNIVKVSAIDRAILKLFDKIVSIVSDSRYLWVISGDNQLYRVALNSFSGISSDLDLFIRSIKNDKEVRFPFTDIIIRPNDNFVYFDIVAPSYIKENSIQYQWKVDKLMDGWSQWQTNPSIMAPFQYGTFTIRVRAKDIWGNTGEINPITYTRVAPFTKTRLFYVLLVVSSLFFIIIIVWLRERRLKKEKHILEEKVKERTSEIEAQKEEITSSIEYASRIQMAMLPVGDHFNELFPDHFIFYKPRDIVSGDFYWIGEDANHIYLTVADCTGHGVPGAFMSTLGVATLNEIITNKKDLHANKVLNLLRIKIKTALHQTGKIGEAADGMDVSFCILHKNRRALEYSGAFNPLILVQNGELREYKGDRMPIGIYVGEKESFANYEIKVNSGDCMYLFSDGMTDQFGGPDGAKYKRSTLKKLLWEIHSQPMEEQKKAVEDEFNKWKGKGEQIDDITVIGVRI